MRLASKKGLGQVDDAEPARLLATIVQTHTGEHVALDDASPTQERFDALLADRVTGQKHGIDPRLLGMLRDLAREHGKDRAVRIEIVSGYRSEKLNEMLRKKGHHVASHSQHSLGHAVDFRVAPSDLRDEGRGIAPSQIELELRAMGWEGGIGVYLSEGDWFTHADVGPNRRWNGQ